MELHWTRTKLAWLGYHPDHAPTNLPPTLDVPPFARDLAKRLLGVAGTRVAVQPGDLHECALVTAHGTLLTVPGVVRKPGARNECHANCARLWRKCTGRYRLGVGWVLDNDCWRCHTWLVDHAGRVVETTLPRGKYFGVVLNPKESEEFVELIEMQTGEPLHGLLVPSDTQRVCETGTGYCPCCGDRIVPDGPKIEVVKQLLGDPTAANEIAPAVPTIRFEARCSAWSR
jgi:hypothetical protein